MRRSATRLTRILSHHQFIPPSRIKHSYSCRHLSTTSPPAPTPLALTLAAQIKVPPGKHQTRLPRKTGPFHYRRTYPNASLTPITDTTLHLPIHLARGETLSRPPKFRKCLVKSLAYGSSQSGLPGVGLWTGISSSCSLTQTLL
jgi:hypothetical protein